MADLDPLVAASLKRIESGRKEQTTQIARYNRAYDIWRASEPKSRGTLPWQSKLRVKYAMQVIDTALVNIVSGQPRCMVRPRHPENEAGAKAMQMLMDYYVQEDHLVEKQPVFAQQALIYGVTVAKNHWLYREGVRTERGPDGRPHEVPVIDKDGPCFEPWDVYRCFWEPGARDVDSAGYVVLQSYLSKDELLKLAHDKDTGEGLYHNVDALLATGAGDQPTQTNQSRANNTDERTKDKFLIEEIWTDENLIVVGNKQVLLRAQPNPYWHGKKPIVITQVRPDLFEMVGVSETELVDHIQQALWTLQNMTMDNLHLTVMRGFTYREGGVLDPSILQLRPRFLWPVSDHDDIHPVEMQPISSDVFEERQRLLSDMQLVTGINPYISGTDTAGVDQNTATGVTALQEVASRLLRFKASQIHYKGYQRSFEMWGDMAQQFFDRDQWIKIVGPGGVAEWQQVTPQDIVGHYDYVLEGSEESLSRQQERGEAIALLNAFAPLIPTGQVNVAPILEKVAAAYDFPNPEALLAAPQQAPQAAPMQQPQAQGGVQPLLNQQQLDPRVAGAITAGR